MAPDHSEPLTLEHVYRAHAPRVARLVSRLLGPSPDIEDVVHEVFLVVERKLDSFRGDAALSTWLHTITVRVVAKHRRRARLAHWLPFFEEHAASNEASPFEHVVERETVTRVYRILDRLREKDRTVLVLHEIDGLSGPEIAEILRVKPTAVWVRLHRARKRFRQLVAEEEVR